VIVGVVLYLSIMNSPESVDLNINITFTIDTKSGKSSPVVKGWTDESIKHPADVIHRLQQENESRVQSWVQSHKSKVDTRTKKNIVKDLLNQLDLNRHHYLITWTYGDKSWGYDPTKVEIDIKNIRSRIIKLFHQNFKSKNRKKPYDDFPNMYFWKETHDDGQYHIHLLMESIDPDLISQSLDKESFLLRFYTIRQKIMNRKDLIITEKMIERYPEYQYHPLVGRTYDTISQYDGWMISKFLCDYITHYSDGQRWGLEFLSNSPENNHSKVIDSKIELEKKIDYLNKDKYFIKNTNDYLGHLVPEYSDYHL